MNEFRISSLTVSTEGEKGRLRSNASAGSGKQIQPGIWATAKNGVGNQLSTEQVPGFSSTQLIHFSCPIFFFGLKKKYDKNQIKLHSYT